MSAQPVSGRWAGVSDGEILLMILQGAMMRIERSGNDVNNLLPDCTNMAYDESLRKPGISRLAGTTVYTLVPNHITSVSPNEVVICNCEGCA